MSLKTFISTKGGRLAVAGVLAAGLLVGGVAVANGAVKPDCKTLSYPLCPRSVAATQVVDNSLPKSKIAPADRAAFLKDTNTPDVKGSSEIYNFDPAVVAKIGGSFKTNKTKLGEFTLPAGTWKIDMSYFAARTVAGAPGTRMQLALRYGASATEFGADYGTVIGAEISPSKDRELTATGFKYVVNNAPKTIEVFAFGYNDDAGSAGSGDITMSAQVVTVRA